MKRVLIVLLVIIAGLTVFISTRPGHYHVERSATLSAPPAAVYAQIADFHRWDAWSPWEKLDPAMKKTFAGPEAGTGASYHWLGNDRVGEGRMTITDARPDARVAIDLEFIKPFESKNATVFTLVPAGGGTRVVWSMDGENHFMGKAMSLFMDMDRMIGGDFEEGLAGLDSVTAAATDTAAGAAAARDSVTAAAIVDSGAAAEAAGNHVTGRP